MMLLHKRRQELELLKAFQKLFCDDDKNLKPEARKVIAFLRDEAGGRGELGQHNVPYFYDNQNRFDVNAAAFLLGKRRIFDLIIKYLALDEREVFRLCVQAEKKDIDEELEKELIV
ncbi:MAG: hypothetical protein IJ864_00265 [Alphaproteobacteria bacterium]|nr:hypothetical protein [Alphaproteobacteria bacterium]